MIPPEFLRACHEEALKRVIVIDSTPETAQAAMLTNMLVSAELAVKRMTYEAFMADAQAAWDTARLTPKKEPVQIPVTDFPYFPRRTYSSTDVFLHLLAAYEWLAPDGVTWTKRRVITGDVRVREILIAPDTEYVDSASLEVLRPSGLTVLEYFYWTDIRFYWLAMPGFDLCAREEQHLIFKLDPWAQLAVGYRPLNAKTE